MKSISKIWKYPLETIGEPQKIMMPKGAKIRFIHDQNGVPTIWAEVQPGESLKPRWFGIYGTNHALPEYTEQFKHKYIGSSMSGPFVWHIYELDGRAFGK